ncbi:hypothetical protein [Richelia sinica]|uniref:hypothetical protein n=1 Tax=Richelia sinica TaxID=1357545 RepID=UPI0036F4121B
MDNTSIINIKYCSGACIDFKGINIYCFISLAPDRNIRYSTGKLHQRICSFRII